MLWCLSWESNIFKDFDYFLRWWKDHWLECTSFSRSHSQSKCDKNELTAYKIYNDRVFEPVAITVLHIHTHEKTPWLQLNFHRSFSFWCDIRILTVMPIIFMTCIYCIDSDASKPSTMWNVNRKLSINSQFHNGSFDMRVCEHRIIHQIVSPIERNNSTRMNGKKNTHTNTFETAANKRQ